MAIDKPTQDAAQALRDVHPDYDAWTGKDLSKLRDIEIRTLLGTISQSSNEIALLFIPQNFKDRYGDNVRYEVARGVLNEARRRGKPELYSEAMLNGGLRNTLQIPPEADIKLDTPVTEGTISGIKEETTVNAKPAQVASHEASAVLSQMAKAREHMLQTGQQYTNKETAQVHLTPAIAAAVAKANPGLVSPNVSFRYDVDDRGAYMIGYESSSGAAEAVAPQTRVAYTPEQLCQGGQFAPAIFNPKANNFDVGVAWIMGKMQAEFDRLSPNAQKAAQDACPAAVLAPASTPNTSGIANGNGTSAAQPSGGGANAAPNAKGR